MFTRQHYKAIAGILKDTVDADSYGMRIAPGVFAVRRYHCEYIARRLADEVFMPDNEKFDREKFLKACGVKS